jgi:hypothetical protein
LPIASRGGWCGVLPLLIKEKIVGETHFKRYGHGAFIQRNIPAYKYYHKQQQKKKIFDLNWPF